MTIADFFKNKGTYQQGLELLESIPGVKPSLIQNLKEVSPSNFIKLKYELKRIENSNQYQKILLPKKAILKPIKDLVVKNTDDIVKNSLEREFKGDSLSLYPVELHEAYRNRYDYFFKMCSKKIELNAVAPEDHAKALNLILDIETLQTKIDACKVSLDYWKENDRLLPIHPSKDFKNMGSIKLFSKKSNLETSISKRSKTLLKIEEYLNDNPEDRTKQNLYMRRLEELQQLKLDLDAVREIIKDSN